MHHTEGLSVRKSTQIAAAFVEDGVKSRAALQFAKTTRERDLFRWFLGAKHKRLNAFQDVGLRRGV